MNKSNLRWSCAVFFLVSMLLPCDGRGDDEGRPRRTRPLNPITSCGWLDQNEKKDLISNLQEGLEELGGINKDQGTFLPEAMDGVSIHIEAAAPHASGKALIVWCITREGAHKGKEMVKELAMSFKGASPTEDEMPTMSTSDNLPPDTEFTPIFKSLKKSGYLSYVKDNVDHILLYDRPFQCSQLHKPCYGEAKCGFRKTASVAMRSLDTVETAALWVHEAAHLEGCYNDEEYAVEKERDFREKIYSSGDPHFRVSVLSRD